MPRGREALVSLGFALVLITMGWGVRALRVRSMDYFVETQSYEDIYYLPPPAWLQVFSLGHREALADLIFMKGLVYFGEEFNEGGRVRHIFNYADAALALDPDFKRLYRWAGTAGMYRPQATTVEELRRSTDYLREAARRFPDDGEIAWDAGSSIMYELVPHIEDEAEGESLSVEALQYMQTAARMGAGPEWLPMVNASAFRRLGRLDQALRQLEEVYTTVTDPDERRRIEARIRLLSGQRHAEAFAHANETSLSAHEADFPFVPFEFYLLLGPRPPVDELELLRSGFVPSSLELPLAELESVD